MQNSGLGAALTTVHFSLLEAVTSDIFSVWHHVSGSKRVDKIKGNSVVGQESIKRKSKKGRKGLNESHFCLFLLKKEGKSAVY
ncbi:hypothetical protein J7E95_00875 [Streptomyces sp. ISL-14]|nr:hypothetical protein [Streptomyces sp. ISL-14]